jgi:hypothetical protein
VIYLERKRRDEIILLIISREYIPSSLGNIKDDTAFESRKLIGLPYADVHIVIEFIQKLSISKLTMQLILLHLKPRA